MVGDIISERVGGIIPEWWAASPGIRSFGLAPHLSRDAQPQRRGTGQARRTRHPLRRTRREPEADAELPRIEAEIEALTGPETYRPDEIGIAGAFVCLGANGECRIERGYVRPDDDPEAGSEDGENTRNGKAKEKSALSDKLLAELTAYRSAGLRNALAQSPSVALVAVTYALAGSIFYRQRDELSCLQVVPRITALESHAPEIAESPAGRAITARHEEWAKRLPDAPEELWPFVLAPAEHERLDLLAHCASLTVDAVKHAHMRSTDHLNHADALAGTLALDMTAYWQPSVAGYFSRVSKERILEAVSEGVSPQAADNIASMKKAAMAETAAQRLAGTRWLPPVLRSAPAPEITMQEAAE
jgi:ParB family chromosome partitioning protein